MENHRTIVVADHHKSTFVSQILDRVTGEISLRTLKSQRSELEPFLSGLAKPVLVFVEACRAWEWVSDLCEDLEIDIRLVNAARMPEIARSSKKTDKHDVEAMVARLRITGDLPRAYRATRAERELRGLTRRLSTLRNDRRKQLHRIHALIDARGLSAKKALFVKADWREEMESRLSADAWLVLWSLLSQYDVVCDFMERIESRLKELLSDREDYKRLQTIVGVGPVISATILAESAGIDRFSSVRKYAAYTGLVPQVRASGGKVRLGKITREGPADLRWALGQAAMCSARAKQATVIAQMYRRKKKKGKPSRVAICAAAHKLARIVYVLLTRKEDFQAKPSRRKNA